MKTSERFTNAVTKLYNAFHKGELLLTSTCYCAVGNICNNNNDWYDEIINLKEERSIFRSVIDKKYISSNPTILSSGYSAYELGEIERLFAEGHRWSFDEKCKENQFKGLCAVVEYLCELEGIPNVMDYTCLFETENDNPKYQLEKAF